ncbi:MAG: hypothetical protein AABY08_01200 [Candidatus Thermoplasmatota archaeon]|jgi:hypothetical protein|nr:hypothetical protein [Thermoplasmata archaeon]
MTDKNQQFSRLWNETNKQKREKFRNLMKSKLGARRLSFNETNARAFFNGDASSIPSERVYDTERGHREESFNRPRRFPPRRRPGGGGGRRR